MQNPHFIHFPSPIRKKPPPIPTQKKKRRPPTSTRQGAQKTTSKFKQHLNHPTPRLHLPRRHARPLLAPNPQTTRPPRHRNNNKAVVVLVVVVVVVVLRAALVVVRVAVEPLLDVAPLQLARRHVGAQLAHEALGAREVGVW
ncbi:hypothetical protein P167DRAFT_365695 [Morchella conica CCBAS932]|uniref:Uncharacterized protein n=1 Tax=Morchella conica CCBAS932 TaxID=1392247 RepID=A0A3N4KC42_9PEZI|nr:hypothetical protein P167DRAFT_365695 [Morchella conica CCBAS932]